MLGRDRVDLLADRAGRRRRVRQDPLEDGDARRRVALDPQGAVGLGDAEERLEGVVGVERPVRPEHEGVCRGRRVVPVVLEQRHRDGRRAVAAVHDRDLAPEVGAAHARDAGDAGHELDRRRIEGRVVRRIARGVVGHGRVRQRSEACRRRAGCRAVKPVPVTPGKSWESDHCCCAAGRKRERRAADDVSGAVAKQEAEVSAPPGRDSGPRRWCGTHPRRTRFDTIAHAASTVAGGLRPTAPRPSVEPPWSTYVRPAARSRAGGEPSVSTRREPRALSTPNSEATTSARARVSPGASDRADSRGGSPPLGEKTSRAETAAGGRVLDHDVRDEGLAPGAEDVAGDGKSGHVLPGRGADRDLARAGARPAGVGDGESHEVCPCVARRCASARRRSEMFSGARGGVAELPRVRVRPRRGTCRRTRRPGRPAERRGERERGRRPLAVGRGRLRNDDEHLEVRSRLRGGRNAHRRRRDEPGHRQRERRGAVVHAREHGRAVEVLRVADFVRGPRARGFP